jgi:DNA repair exonuclease SbcCD nuclease subunit
MNKPSALLAADYHLRDSQPLCRGDDFISAMIDTSDFIDNICEKYDIPLLIAGDVFHHWKPSPALLRLAIEHMPRFVAIPGQHDLPEHNLRLHPKSGLAVLEAAGIATVLKDPRGQVFLPEKIWPEQTDWLVTGYPYGSEPQSLRRRYPNRRKICMIHQLVSGNKLPFPGAETTGGRALLKNLPGYDLILSGDNHQQFTLEHRTRWVVNPGSVFRTVADQVEHQPAVYLWSAMDNQLEKILLPTESDIILRDHLDQQEEKDKRIDDYIECMENDYEVELDFEHNIREHIRLNGDAISKELTNFIFSCMEVEK